MTRKQIIRHELIKSQEYLTAAELRQRVGLAWGYSTLSAKLSELVKTGLVKKIESQEGPARYVDAEVYENDQWAAMVDRITPPAPATTQQPRLTFMEVLQIGWFHLRRLLGPA